MIVEGVSLNQLIGKRFELQGVLFEGTCECKPCYWMDQAIGPGAEQLFDGRGGLRAKILTDGILRVESGLTSAGRHSKEKIASSIRE